MIMAIKFIYYDVLRVNKTIFAKNSTLSICLKNEARSVFGYQDYEYNNLKLLSWILKDQLIDFDKKVKTGSVAVMDFRG